MPITTNADKMDIFKIISSDPYINSLGYTPDNIYRFKYSWDLITDNTKQIFIYNTTPENNPITIAKRVIFQIEISAPFANYNDVDLAGEQIMALLDGAELTSEKHRLYLYAPPLVLTAPPNFYQIGIRFATNETTFNKKIIKKREV